MQQMAQKSVIQMLFWYKLMCVSSNIGKELDSVIRYLWVTHVSLIKIHSGH